MIRVIDVTPVLDTNAYADNDVLFVPIEVGGVFPQGQPVILDSIIVLDGDDQGVDFDLIFSNATLTLGTINGAVSISDADAAKIVGYVRLVGSTDANDLINSQLYSKGNINLLMAGVAGTGSLFLSGVVRSGTPTYTASGMKIKLGFR